MLTSLLRAVETSPDAGLVGKHWFSDIRTFLAGVDAGIDSGTPVLELGVENRAIMKLTLLPNRMGTTAHVERLPWVTEAQRQLIREIKKARPKFQYSLKLLQEGCELEIYAHETVDRHFQQHVFPEISLAGLHDIRWFRVYALTNTNQVSSYWADPEMRGLNDAPRAVIDAARTAGSLIEPWVHYLWNGNSWGPAKTGIQFVPALAELDAALRREMPEIRFLDLFGAPRNRHSAQIASGAGRQCLYMALNGKAK